MIKIDWTKFLAHYVFFGYARFWKPNGGWEWNRWVHIGPIYLKPDPIPWHRCYRILE